MIFPPLWILLVPFFVAFAIFVIIFVIASYSGKSKLSADNLEKDQGNEANTITDDVTSENSSYKGKILSLKICTFILAGAIFTIVGGIAFISLFIAVVKMFPNHF